MMTRKDYEKIAEVLRMGIRPVQADVWYAHLVGRFATMLLADNPRFDVERFKEACEDGRKASVWKGKMRDLTPDVIADQYSKAGFRV